MPKTKDFLSDLRGLTAAQLSGKIAESQKALVMKSQDKLLGSLKNTSEIKHLRRSIAQMRTILDEKISAEVKESK